MGPVGGTYDQGIMSPENLSHNHHTGQHVTATNQPDSGRNSDVGSSQLGSQAPTQDALSQALALLRQAAGSPQAAALAAGAAALLSGAHSGPVADAYHLLSLAQSAPCEALIAGAVALLEQRLLNEQPWVARTRTG